METIRWGILATGHISDKFAQALTDQPDAVIVAAGSRSQEHADAFGSKWNVPYCYASYEQVVAHPDVDVVYIGTPHSLHSQNMQLALEAGKHVLCEKPFTINAEEARRSIAIARARGLFLMEAMWMRYLPAIRQASQWIREGAIGELRLVEACFAMPIPYDPQHRLYNPDLGGGALLDMGIYPISLAVMLLGLPDTVLSRASMGETGVDELNTTIFGYTNGASAVLISTQRLFKPNEAYIVGTGGYIKIHNRFFRATRLTLDDGEKELTVERPFESNGYVHQIREVHACLRAGELESSIMPLDESLAIMALMDRIRAQWGLVYPGETPSTAS